jgi:hypothetical protein
MTQDVVTLRRQPFVETVESLWLYSTLLDFGYALVLGSALVFQLFGLVSNRGQVMGDDEARHMY